MPDGTIYDAFGSRNTALVYASGIEYMGLQLPEDKEVQDLVCRVRQAFKNRITIPYETLEFDNFIRIYYDLLIADEWRKQYRKEPIQNTVANKSFQLPELGFYRVQYGDNKSIYFHINYGGAFCVYEGDQLIARNAGYLLSDKDNNFYGTKNHLQNSSKVRIDEQGFELQCELIKSIHQDLSPLKLVVMRILNLTVLRNRYLADFFRYIVVKLLITGRHTESDGYFCRVMTWGDTKLRIVDTLKTQFDIKYLAKVTHLNLFHMASSRYFDPLDGSQGSECELSYNGKNFTHDFEV
ncbi:MAG: hypothetical protein KDD40_11010, partial [Bdellovibrionales bacterium]|nr:hypothetical protein [Bdellovibrionales bacterium]